MSWNTHKRAALDTTQPFAHRLSHARSLAVMVSSRHGVDRSQVLEAVRRNTGIDLTQMKSDVDLNQAIECLENLRVSLSNIESSNPNVEPHRD